MIKIENKNFFRAFLGIGICIFIILYFTNTYAKYVFQDEFCVANLNIDRTRPQIELISIQNSDSEYKNYANKTHKVIAKIKVEDKNLKEIFLDTNYFKIKINDKFIDNVNIEFGEVQDKVDYKVFDVRLSNLEVDGNLKLVFLEGFAVDYGELKNEYIEIATNIVVDNTIPVVQSDESEFVIDSFGDDVGVFSLN